MLHTKHWRKRWKKCASLLAAAILAGSAACKPEPVRLYVIAPSGLNLRTAPNAASAPVKLLAPGTEVIVVEEQTETSQWQGLSGRWTKVKADNVEGWAFGAFLSAQKPPAAAGSYGPCHYEPNVSVMFGTDRSYRSCAIGMCRHGTYVEEGSIITVTISMADTNAVTGEPGPIPPSVVQYELRNGVPCQAGACLCRR